MKRHKRRINLCFIGEIEADKEDWETAICVENEGKVIDAVDRDDSDGGWWRLRGFGKSLSMLRTGTKKIRSFPWFLRFWDLPTPSD
ncbi:hypothetical protein HYC85_002056 [Camellia sinensis]|uniref:Uncharacterized protein n=1 Tax=Camellia sinensis TaxID=4442 RepID=A0A7J7I8J9_CAMSI|nr:hypothetical protein HYC85_002056 [Camellia sinensis]